MSARYKPGSRVQMVWERYEAGGASAAFDFGLTLNLKPTTLKAWVRMWANGQDKTTRPTAYQPAPPIGKKRVYVGKAGDQECLATLLQEGNEVSLVRWDQPDIFGRESYVANKHIYPTD